MNGVHLNGREKPVPGCLGRVANLFDLTSAVARNRLLTEKPHFPEGSTLSRSRSDVSRMSSPVAHEMEDKMIVSEMTRSYSTKRSGGTPVKMLIAQELSKDLESTPNSPNLVAKLMGLDALPDLGHERSSPSCHLQNCYSEVPMGYWHQEDENHQCQEQFTYKDIYEIRYPSAKTNGSRDVSPLKRCNENADERKMALIRKKFMDAKRPSTDEKLRQTKEFQEALEVLSCNPDLFLKVLHEPSSLITHHLYGRSPLPLPTETKRITVLKPSKMVLNDKFPASCYRNEKQVKKSPLGNHQANWRVDDSPKPTRIVLLKPSSGRIQDVLSSPSGNVHETDSYDEPREVAKEIMQRMRENLAGNRKDESFIPSVFSNGYIGDESSFRKSEDEFVGNISESEVMSPASRHCWDYVNQYGSPYSCSSLGRVSSPPESSVAREAKKRLSERWAMMSSNKSAGEQRQVQRSSSTLGEMLALSDVKPEAFEVDDPERDYDPRVSTSCLSTNFGGDVQSPRTSLARSKSLPTASGLRLNAEGLDAGSTKQTTKSSLRGKVTSLFFPKSKKPSKEKHDKSQAQDQASPNHAESSEFTSDSSSHYNGSKEIKFPVVQSVNRSIWAESSQGLAHQQVVWSTLKPATCGMSSENQDQPSPISVLEPPFEDDGSNTTGFSDVIIPNQHGKHMAFTSGKSNLIDKSPLIGSIARTLSWDEPCTQPATSDSQKTQDGFQEEEWHSLIQSLLSLAGLEDESQVISNHKRWYSPESPLDPLLREKYADHRRLRSNHQLVFDFVNSALLDMTGMGSNASQWARCKRPGDSPAGEALAMRVWTQMKKWLVGGGWAVGEEEDGEDSGNVVAEMAVRKELMGREWDDEVRLQIDIIGKEIEGKLIEEMVEESIGDMNR